MLEWVHFHAGIFLGSSLPRMGGRGERRGKLEVEFGQQQVDDGRHLLRRAEARERALAALTRLLKPSSRPLLIPDANQGRAHSAAVRSLPAPGMETPRTMRQERGRFLARGAARSSPGLGGAVAVSGLTVHPAAAPVVRARSQRGHCGFYELPDSSCFASAASFLRCSGVSFWANFSGLVLASSSILAILSGSPPEASMRLDISSAESS